MGILDSAGAQVVSYVYDSWGKLESVTGEQAETIGRENPFRYRGYYYDEETGFYYLQSRYYDPGTGRFLNADGYVSTGQGIVGTNMFAYCGNNPVMRTDPSGSFWQTFIEIIEKSFRALAPVISVLGGAAVADGPFPVGDAVAVVGLALLTVGVVAYGVYAAATAPAPSISIPKVEEKEKAQAPPPEDTVIYRYHSSKTSNLAPRPGIDYDGLSFSTRPPRPGVDAVVTTVNTVNATGVLRANVGAHGHVTIVPVGATVEQWMNEGQGSLWSQTLSAIVVEWDGDK